MKILITGGTVFVSRYLAEYFVGKDHEVTVMNRGTHPQVKGVRLIRADKSEPCSSLRNMTFDLVLAVNIYTSGEMNALLESLGDYGTVIFISSSAVYPETTALPFRETDPVGRNAVWGDYGWNKIGAEQTLLQRCPDAYVLRPPYFYGKYQNIYREAFVFDCAEKGMPFYLPKDGTMPLQFFHVGDLCRLIEAIEEKKPEDHIINTGNRPIDINTYVEWCYDVVGAELVKVFVDAAHPQRGYFPFHDYAYVLDTHRQSLLLPETWPEIVGLEEEYAWYREHPQEVMKKTAYETYIREHF